MKEWIVREDKRSGGMYPSKCYEKIQELVRCKECANWKDDKFFCKIWKTGTPANGHCYMADRKTDSEKPNNCEPQTNADQHVQHIGCVETMSCEECKHWIFTSRWGYFCPLKGKDECNYEPIEDEPQTERSE